MQRLERIRSALPILLFLMMAAKAEDKPLAFSHEGATEYAILLADDASLPEKHAASELASYLKQITGAQFETINRLAAGRLVIAVGAGAAETVSAGIDLKDLGNDGIVIQTVGSNLILTGGKAAPRGTLYAVYTFLEGVGVRWWAPGATDVPSHPTLAVAVPTIRYKPVLEYRDPFIKVAFDSDYAVRNKINGPYRQLDEAHGGLVSYAGFVHTFFELVPPAEHFKTHPEWYSEIKGVRKFEKAQLCLTNKELLPFVIKRVREWIAQNPEPYLRKGTPASIVSVSQNDWHGRCECQECLKVEAEEGSPSGPLLRFVNAIAEDVERDFPNVAIDTLAYMYTRKPPSITRPRPNVIIRLCSIECSFLQPLDTQANKSFRDDIVAWSKICNRVYIWDYVINFQHYLAPHPNLRVLGPNIRFFIKHGVKGILEQGNNRSLGGEFEELKAWVLAKILWNPEANADALIDEFLNGFYGAAAPKLREYINLLHDRAEATKHYLDLNDDLKGPYLNTETLAKFDALLREALDAVKDHEVHRKRVECAGLATKYVFALRWPYLQREAELMQQPWPVKVSRDELISEIRELCDRNQITALNEDWSGDQTPHGEVLVKKYGGRKAPTRPEGFENVATADFIDLQDECAQLWKRPQHANWIADEKASDGKAAWMPGDHANWNFYLLLKDPSLKAAFDAEWSAYAVVRIEKQADTGTAFSVGIHDQAAGKKVLSLEVKAADVPDGNYRIYKLGRFTPKASHYLWAAPGKNAGVPAIWVDRFFLVREKN
jgi:hypothetical protein